mgnify:FL=1
MLQKLKEAKEKATEYFSKNPLTREHETAISLFISGVKSANLMILSKIQYQPVDWRVFKFMHQQIFKDTQLFSLLNRSTDWSWNPLIYWKISGLLSELWSKANLQNYILSIIEKDVIFFRYLSLSHAFKSEVRHIPLFPSTLQFDTPFLSALYDIEVQNQREIQTQIALLKNLDVPLLNIQEKENLVKEQRDVVADVFADYLKTLSSI